MISQKKFTMTIVGLILIMIVFLSCAFFLYFQATLAAQMIPFAQIVVTTISGLTAVYTGAQAAVDWKSASPPK